MRIEILLIELRIDACGMTNITSEVILNFVFASLPEIKS
jgi:hypothetical protein